MIRNTCRAAGMDVGNISNAGFEDIGDADDIAFRAVLIDTFVSKIYLYDGDDARVEIYCNATNKNPCTARFLARQLMPNTNHLAVTADGFVVTISLSCSN